MGNLYFPKPESMKKLFLILFVSALVFSCVSPKITVERISELQEIEQGDSVWIHWKFANASYVKLPSVERDFNPVDSFLLKPFNSTRVDVTAYNDKGESLVQSVYVLVRPKETKEERKTPIQRGPLGTIDLKGIKNNVKTKFLSGFVSNSFDKAVQLKIFRVSFSNNLDSCSINFGILDTAGNLIYDLYKYSSDIKLETVQECPKLGLKSYVYAFPKELTYGKKLNLFVLIDYSIINFLPDIKEQLVNGLKFLESFDKLSISVFGVQRNTLLPLERFDKAYWELGNLVFSPKVELSAVHRTLYDLLDDVVEDENTAIVMLTNQMDNSSINVLLDDVIKKANSKKAEIYVIGLGNEVSILAYKYLCLKTGGNFYHLPWDFNRISDVLREILLSKKYSYTITFPFNYNASNCSDVLLKLRAYSNYYDVSDVISYPLKERMFYINYQAVALFNENDTSVSSSFLPVLNNLTNLLRSSKNSSLELIGNAGLSESMKNPVELSLARANSVKRILVSKGVNPSQIKIKGIGNSNPLFMEENDERTSWMNRRVEIRWLLPSVYPYTIVVDTVESEELAEKKVENWEKNGFKSYYVRLYDNGAVKYKVVLWGYPDIEKAERDARIISRKYKKACIVE